MNVLMITQKLDSCDELLGFTHGWAESLAGHVNGLSVLCLATGKSDLPPNVRVEIVGVRKGVLQQLLRLAVFYDELLKIIRRGGAEVIFAHMCPEYVIAAWPVARLKGIPIVLWYTHSEVSWRLRLAHLLSARVVTASRESFPLPSRKLSVLGHAINTEALGRSNGFGKGAERLVLSLGRISPIKRYETLLRAAAQICQRPDCSKVRFAVVGGPPDGRGEEYLAKLLDLRDRLGLKGRFEFVGPVPHSEIKSWLERCLVFVNLSDTDSLDKAVLEAMACRKPVVTSNTAFAGLLVDSRLVVRKNDPSALAEKLRVMLALPPNEREALGERMRQLVHPRFSLEHTMESLAALFRDTARSQR